MIAIDRRTLLAAVAAAGALPAPAFARAPGAVLDMTSTYPHYAAAIGFGCAGCDAPDVGAADRMFAP